MRVIYIDSLFLLNLAVDYFLLLLTATVSGIYQRRSRLVSGAFVGGGLAVLGIFLPEGAVWSLLFRSISCLLVVLTAFGKRKAAYSLRLCGTFLLLTTVLAGILFALSPAMVENGVIYADFSLPLMILAFCVIYLLSGIVLGKGRAEVGRGFRKISVRMGQRRVTFRALVDSGNLLRDPISGQRVMVVSGGTLANLFDSAGRTLLENPNTYPPEELLLRLRRCCKTAFWMLPIHTAATKRMMLVFRPEELYIDGKKSDEYLLGVTEKQLDIGDDCCALIGV